MLILSRRVNEAIVIDGSIRVVVTSLIGKSVKLAISAPRDVPILRAELEPRPTAARGTAAGGLGVE